MTASTGHPLGQALMDRLDALASFTDEPGRLTRLYLSPAHKAAAAQVMDWMAVAGMAATIDAAGNVVGRYEGSGEARQTLLLGSHIDTVRNAGKYDGNLGVLAAIACVQALGDAGTRLPYAIEVFAFGNEEGVRFPTTLTGSRAVSGTLDLSTLEVRDADGASVREALVAFGCDPAAVPAAARRPDDLLGYVELHIEQGPVLEAEGLPIGIVTAINGACRYRVDVIGEAGHAGTVPMNLRRDALAAAAEMVLAVERVGRSEDGLVATVGSFEIAPGGSNVIPGGAQFTIDLRAPNDALRDHAATVLQGELAAIAERRRVELTVERFYEAAAATCSDDLVEPLEAAVRRSGIRPLRLPSGAGHDGLAVLSLCPIAMLFLRCKGGVSHNPAEAIAVEDADIALRVMLDFLRELAPAT
ncbi:MAG: allantoate amidohydrolase [Inquilinus sp.]|nr:allantoate amidohydrolase [Inquilinus sp.]